MNLKLFLCLFIGIIAYNFFSFVPVENALKLNWHVGDVIQDPTGTIQGCISHKVLSDLKFGSNIGPGAVIILMKVLASRPVQTSIYRPHSLHAKTF
jgi:hypothetical protein